MGWPAIERIWLPMWLKDSNGEILRIEKIAQHIISGKTLQGDLETRIPTPADPLNAAKTEVVSLEPSPPELVAEPAKLENMSYWTPWEIKLIGEKWQLDGLPGREAETAVRSAMELILRTEAPIEPMRAARLVGQAYGLSAMFETRAEEILRVTIPGTTRDQEGFIYLESQNPEGGWANWRSSQLGDSRKISEISLYEISNAMRYLAEISLGITEEELFKETASAFGIQRLTDTVKLRLMLALRTGFSRGTLREDGTHIVAS
jgi:hypothetical protein